MASAMAGFLVDLAFPLGLAVSFRFFFCASGSAGEPRKAASTCASPGSNTLAAATKSAGALLAAGVEEACTSTRSLAAATGEGIKERSRAERQLPRDPDSPCAALSWSSMHGMRMRPHSQPTWLASWMNCW